MVTSWRALTLDIKFDELLVIIACAEEDFRIDFTNSVHINPFSRNVKANKTTLDSKIIWKLEHESILNIQH